LMDTIASKLGVDEQNRHSGDALPPRAKMA
jgi:hypothetical protein